MTQGSCTTLLALLIAGLLSLDACGGGSDAQLGGDTTPSQNLPSTVPDTGNPSGDSGTITFDVTTGSNAPDQSFLDIHPTGQPDSTLQIGTQDGSLRTTVTSDAGDEEQIAVPIDAWSPGQLHSITLTWGDGVASVYVDGVLVGQQSYSGTVAVPPGTPVSIGSPGDWRPVTIQDFHVYGQALPPDQVAALGPPSALP